MKNEKSIFRRQITVFKSLAISTIVYLAMMKPIPKLISTNFRKIKNVFYRLTQILKQNTTL